MTLDEQETTVTQLRGGDTLIYTANPVHLRALRKRVAEGRATERDGDDTYGNFVIPNADFDPLKGFKQKRKPLTEEQRTALATRLEHARKSQNRTV